MRFARPRKPAWPEIAWRRLARSPPPFLRASSRTERDSAPPLRVSRPRRTRKPACGGTRKFTERVEESRYRLGFKPYLLLRKFMERSHVGLRSMPQDLRQANFRGIRCPAKRISVSGGGDATHRRGAAVGGCVLARESARGPPSAGEAPRRHPLPWSRPSAACCLTANRHERDAQAHRNQQGRVPNVPQSTLDKMQSSQVALGACS